MVSVSDLKNVQTLFPNARVSYISPSPAGSLHYLNIRVTERLHRYRLLKRQWHDLQPAAQNNLSRPKAKSISPTSDSQEQKVRGVKDRRSTTAVKTSGQKTALKLEPLRLQIEQDILQLRKMIRTRQKKLTENAWLRTTNNDRSSRVQMRLGAAANDQGNYPPIATTQKSALDGLHISGPGTRSAIFPQNALTDSGVVTIRHPTVRFSSTPNGQRKIKQQINTTAFNICGYRVNPSPPADPPISRKSSPNPHPRNVRTTASRQSLPLRTSMPSVGKEQPLNTNKSGSLSSSSYSSADSKETLTCHYTHAASTSSTIPRSVKFHQDTSLLSAFLTSNSSLHAHDQEPDNDNSFLYEKPIISPHGYDVLVSQLDRLRVTMPTISVYNSYTRRG